MAKQMGWDPPIETDEKKRKCSEANKARSSEFNKENGRKISEAIQQKVKNGTWHTSLSRRMHINYKGNDLHGSWELLYAQYLDNNSIRWIRCKESFPYWFEDSYRRYTPDFYLTDKDEYIEIKGFETTKDLAKWEQFPTDKKLTVLKKRNLIELNIL